MRHELADLRDQKQEVEGKLNRVSKNLEQVDQKLKSTSTHASESDRMIHKLKKEESSLEDQLAKHEAAIAEKKASLIKAQDSLKAAKIHSQELEATIQKLKKDNKHN